MLVVGGVLFAQMNRTPTLSETLGVGGAPGQALDALATDTSDDSDQGSAGSVTLGDGLVRDVTMEQVIWGTADVDADGLLTQRSLSHADTTIAFQCVVKHALPGEGVYSIITNPAGDAVQSDPRVFDQDEQLGAYFQAGVRNADGLLPGEYKIQLFYRGESVFEDACTVAQ